MLKFQKLVLGELATNCYIVWDEEKRGVIIDPADEGAVISEWMEERGIKPMLILATHGHFDHILAVEELKLIYHVPFGLSSRDEFLIKNMEKSANYWLSGQQSLVKIDKIEVDLDKQDEIEVGDIKISVVKTPGHTPGGCCLWIKSEEWLFTGDLLFADGVGRTDLSYSSKADLAESIKRISELTRGTEILPGHGESFRS